MDVSFEGGEKMEITVDSGAEESVCPWAWGEQFGIEDTEVWMNFEMRAEIKMNTTGKEMLK